jgi:F-type H+-transporting ATPase subunit delta
MDDKLAAKRYAAALVAATREKELTEILALLDNLVSLFAGKKFVEKIKSPLMPNAAKIDAIVSAFNQKGKTSDKWLVKLNNLIALLVEKNRLTALPYIVKEAKAAIAGKQSVYNGALDAKKPLDASKLEGLGAALAKRLGAQVKLTQSDKIYDGVRVAIDDLGVEVDFSKARIGSQVLSHILRGL